jgi:hypothetical protein
VKEGLVGGVELIGELLFLFQDLEVAVHLFLS